MKLRFSALAALLFCGFAAHAAKPPTPATPATPAVVHADAGIAWFKGDVDAAFAHAKAQNKPLFLFWGASWCPPCNQVKATIFNRQAFIERSRYFVPVYVDGDSPSAQKIGARFKVRGYPTMLLFKADGAEITRLPGEVDSARYMQVLTLGMNANHSAKDLLQIANTTPGKLTADDWRMLSFYTWYGEEQQLVAAKEIPATLLRLAKLSTDAESALRLQIRGWLAQHEAGVKSAVTPAEREQLMKLVQDAQWSRDHMDLITNGAPELVEILSHGVQRAPVQAVFQQALHKLLQDQSLSRADRLGALTGLVGLARHVKDAPLPEDLLQLVRSQVAQIEGATKDTFERQAVVSAAAHALGSAGLLDESDQLLKAELKRSHSPYYFMLTLASNAKKRKDTAAALSWHEQAYQAAKGPATRLQWGTAYLNGVLDLTPDDETRIEQVARSVLQELAKTPDAFYDRNRGVIERSGRKLASWNLDGKHQAVFAKVQAQLDEICGTLPKNDAERAVCKGILNQPKEQM